MHDPITATSGAPDFRVHRAGRGADWLGEAFGLFRRQPGVWIGTLLLWMVLSAAIGAVPGLNIASSFLNPIFTAGLMLGCASLERGEGLRVEHLFAGFRSGHLGPLLMLTVWSLLLVLAMMVVFSVVALVALGGHLDQLADPERLFSATGLTGALLLVLAVLTAGVVLAMALWFAPALIVFRKLTALEAIKLSFRGCMANWASLSVYGLLVMVMLLVAMLPLLLGLLVAAPVMVASIYTSYRDIYGA